MEKPANANGLKNTLRDTPETSVFVAFKGMKIDSGDFLDTLEGRSKCPRCNRSRKFFCYSCYLLMPPLEGRIPQIKLPLEIAVIKHPQELHGKSTSTHGIILAPESVKIYTYPDLPDTENTILVFPDDNAEDAGEFMERSKKENNGVFPYKRVIFIDSTWSQTHQICHNPKIVNIPRVKINGIESLFWRYQTGNPITFLATIEAMYHFSVITHKAVISPDYQGEYDNLLFFFKYMFFKIRGLYDPKKLRSYASRPYLQERDPVQ